MKLFICLFGGLTLLSTISTLSPVGKINLPMDFPQVTYKGKIFSYQKPLGKTSNSRPIRDFVLDTDTVRQLEQDFSAHFTELIIEKFAGQMKEGIPSMMIPSLDPLRLKPIVAEPRIAGTPFQLSLSDIEVSGLSEVQIQDIRPRLNVLKVRLSLLFSKISVGSQFALNGTIFDTIKINGDGRLEMDFFDVSMRTQLSLIHANHTLQIDRADPPMIDYNGAHIRLLNINNIEKDKHSSYDVQDAAPVLFWIVADNIAEEVDRYLLKYINNQLLHFAVPEDFTPVVTWLMNRQAIGSVSGMGSSGSGNAHPHDRFGLGHPFQPMSRLSPFPFLSQFFNHLSNNLRPDRMHHHHTIHTSASVSSPINPDSSTLQTSTQNANTNSKSPNRLTF